MEALLQAGLSGQAPAQPEKRFLITTIHIWHLALYVSRPASYVSLLTVLCSLLLAPCSAFAVPVTNGLVLWLDAKDPSGNGSRPADYSSLAGWTDKSGTGHSATQTVAGSRPTFRYNGIGTNPVVRFDGDDWLTAGTIRSTVGNVHAFVVAQRSGSQSGGDTYQRLVSTSDGGNTYDWEAPDWCITGVYDGSGGDSLSFGPDIRSGGASDGTLKIANLNVGRDAANLVSRLRGDIAEVLVYTNYLTGADLTSVTNYLYVKWLADTNSPPEPRPLVGAIRWDAWIGQSNWVGAEVNRSLGPQHWHYRLPYFGTEISPTQVNVQSTTQLDADRQIAMAKAAGLDYWAYCMYATNDPMTRYGIDLHLSSAHRDDMKFCMINQGDRPSGWTNFISRMLGHFQRSNHVTVMGGRPLFYMLDGSVLVGAEADQWATWSAYGAAFNQLRAAVTNAGLPNPYLVYMYFDAANAHSRKTSLGFDAISSYAWSGNDSAAPYSTLVGLVQGNWTSYRDTGSQVIPLAMIGWDRRPRVENPVGWETWQLPGVGIDQYYAAPTAGEWATHLQAAMDWVRTYPSTCPADAVIIYSWNEIDEGGWMLPDRTLKTMKLEATRDVLDAGHDQDGDGADDLWELWHFPALTKKDAGTF